MRIIGGEFRSRRLLTPPDASVTRPIPDRVKESLFGLLRGHMEGARVFDGFAGIGAIGLEAVSRGAAECVFVERDRRIAEILRGNIEALGAEDRCEVVVGDALGPGALARCPRPATLVFLDPPYPLIGDEVGWKRVRTQLERLIDLLTDDGFAILRTPWPFMIRVEPEAGGGGEGEEGAKPGELDAPARRRQREPGAKRRGGRGRRSEEAGDEASPDEAEGDAAAAGTRVAPDMKLSNGEGPETHAYHTTAVHLYARRKV